MLASNYAFISVLYLNKSTGLYKDIYYPIIKYAVVSLYNNRSLTDNSNFFTTDEIQDFIWEKVRIKIPHVVISKTIEKLYNTQHQAIELELMERGNSYRIISVHDDREFADLENQEEHFTDVLSELELDYKTYLNDNGYYDDKVTYLQFISDNTEDILGYFQNEDSKMVDEKYTTIIFFLEYLKLSSTNKEKFEVANHLFWASIIAAFLKSEKPIVTDDNDGVRYEYFLDTSILMGLLKLSTKQKETYALEIRNIINASGGIMRAHPITLKEISKILVSVEQSKKPQLGTDIAEAWDNHHYNIHDLSGIRVRLQKEIENVGISVFPILSENNLRQIEQEYSSKPVIKSLAQERSRRPDSYSSDYFREIHDIFMDDFIKARRKEKKDENETIFFVTSNRDLINFTRRFHPEEERMKSTGKIILELWMHDAKPSDISNCALTETMARCLDMHNMRVRNKIAEVSKYYNQTKDNFDPEVYADFIKQLYKRAKNVITVVESEVNNNDLQGKDKIEQIINAVKADQTAIEKRVEFLEKKSNDLELALATNEEKKENLEIENAIHQKNLISLKDRNIQLSASLKQIELDLSDANSNLIAEQQRRKEVEHIAGLYKKRDQLISKKKELECKIAPLESLRESSFKNRIPSVFITSGFIMLAVCAGLGYLAWKNTSFPLGILIAPLVAVAIFLFNRANSLNDRIKERKSKAYNKWEEKKENQLYGHYKSELSNVNNDLNQINSELNNTD